MIAARRRRADGVRTPSQWLRSFSTQTEKSQTLTQLRCSPAGKVLPAVMSFRRKLAQERGADYAERIIWLCDTSFAKTSARAKPVSSRLDSMGERSYLSHLVLQPFRVRNGKSKIKALNLDAQRLLYTLSPHRGHDLQPPRTAQGYVRPARGSPLANSFRLDLSECRQRSSGNPSYACQQTYFPAERPSDSKGDAGSCSV
jgi:hypothetical protein